MQVLFGINQRLRVEDIDSPLIDIRPVKTVLLVIVTGDRGLCGGYNNFIIRKVSIVLDSPAALLPHYLLQRLHAKEGFPVQAENRAKELQKLGINVKVLTVGKKGGTYFKRRSDQYNIAGWSPANEACKELLVCAEATAHRVLQALLNWGPHPRQRMHRPSQTHCLPSLCPKRQTKWRLSTASLSL